MHGTEDLGGLAFRGYVLPQLHSYSPESEVLAYWASRSFEEHNGVFSTAYIGRRGETLTLVTASSEWALCTIDCSPMSFCLPPIRGFWQWMPTRRILSRGVR